MKIMKRIPVSSITAAKPAPPVVVLDEKGMIKAPSQSSQSSTCVANRATWTAKRAALGVLASSAAQMTRSARSVGGRWVLGGTGTAQRNSKENYGANPAKVRDFGHGPSGTAYGAGPLETWNPSNSPQCIKKMNESCA